MEEPTNNSNGAIRFSPDDRLPWNVIRFNEIATEMSNTYRNKNHDYGDVYTAGFARFGPTQFLSRIYEKFERLYNILYLKKDSQVSDESVCDTLTDMAVQCIVLRMFLKGENVKPMDFENVK